MSSQPRLTTCRIPHPNFLRNTGAPCATKSISYHVAKFRGGGPVPHGRASALRRRRPQRPLQLRPVRRRALQEPFPSSTPTADPSANAVLRPTLLRPPTHAPPALSLAHLPPPALAAHNSRRKRRRRRPRTQPPARRRPQPRRQPAQHHAQRRRRGLDDDDAHAPHEPPAGAAREPQGADLRVLRLRAVPVQLVLLPHLPAVVVPAVAVPARPRHPLLPGPVVEPGDARVYRCAAGVHLRGAGAV